MVEAQNVPAQTGGFSIFRIVIFGLNILYFVISYRVTMV